MFPDFVFLSRTLESSRNTQGRLDGIGVEALSGSLLHDSLFVVLANRPELSQPWPAVLLLFDNHPKVDSK